MHQLPHDPLLRAQHAPALVHRLKEIFDFVKDLRRDVVVIENCDCVDFEDERRIRATTGANSVIIATAAEANSTLFSLHQLTNLENTFILAYLRLVRSCLSISHLPDGCVVQISG